MLEMFSDKIYKINFDSSNFIDYSLARLLIDDFAMYIELTRYMPQVLTYKERFLMPNNIRLQFEDFISPLIHKIIKFNMTNPKIIKKIDNETYLIDYMIELFELIVKFEYDNILGEDSCMNLTINKDIEEDVKNLLALELINKDISKINEENIANKYYQEVNKDVDSVVLDRGLPSLNPKDISIKLRSFSNTRLAQSKILLISMDYE